MARRATVVGSGPNGLAAAVALARAGYDVRVLEASDTDRRRRAHRRADPARVPPRCRLGRPPRCAQLAVLPRVRAARAHRVDHARRSRTRSRSTAGARRSPGATSSAPPTDSAATRRAWLAVLRPLSSHLDAVVDFTGSQLLRMPRHPVTTVRFGLRALQLGTVLGRGTFATEEANALLSGVLAHANTPLPSVGAAASGLFLAAHAHAGDGWAYPRGGAQRIADALVADLRAHGGEVVTGHHVTLASTASTGATRLPATCCCSTPRRGCCSPTPTSRPRTRGRSAATATAPAAAKVDFALDGPIPWAAPRRRPLADRAPRRHPRRGGGERERRRPRRGHRTAPTCSPCSRPCSTRPARPTGKQVLWAYIHVPAGLHRSIRPSSSPRQVERFAPGFRERILASHAMTAAERVAFNPSDIGGDILGGAFTLRAGDPAPDRLDDAVAHADAAACTSPRRRPRPGPESPECRAGTRPARRCATPAGVRLEPADLFRT